MWENRKKLSAWLRKPSDSIHTYPPSYLFALGQAYYLLGRHEEDIVAYKRLLTRNPDHSRAHFFLTLLYYEVGRREDAREALAACKRTNPLYSFQRTQSMAPYKDQTVVKRWMMILRELKEP